MSQLHWVRMPSTWINQGYLKSRFSSHSTIGEDIAALKIYIALAYNAKKVGSTLESKITYDDLSDVCSLSRLLISKGLKKLVKEGLITSSGRRIKVYVLSGSTISGWCKLPVRDVVSDDWSIPYMKGFFNRTISERNALKIYLYILAIRNNSLNYVDVSRKTLSEKTGVKIEEINAALGFLSHTTMIASIENRGSTLKSGNIYHAGNQLDRYFVLGYQYLVRKP